jgi:hypothetical protein
MSRVLLFCLVLVTGCASAPPPPYIVGKPSDKPCNWSPETQDGVDYLALVRLSDNTMVAQGAYAARITLGVVIQEPDEMIGHEKVMTLYASPTDGRIPITGLPNTNGLRAISCEAFYGP